MDDAKAKLDNLKIILQIDDKRMQLVQIQDRLNSEDVWKDWETGQKLSQAQSEIKKELEDFEMLELLLEDGNMPTFEKEFRKLEFKTFLSGPHDKGDAIISIHAGQGGTDAMDWVDMLFRMYSRYAEQKDWKMSLINKMPGDVAGLKSVSFELFGLYAYGFLREESGVHRLVRLSPFNSDNLRQTSFALVEVIPLIGDNIEVDLKDEDVEFEAYRSGGPGGQNVNKVSTAVRIKHIPTGIVVECQEERLQGKNREKALRILKAKLYALELKKLEDEKNRLRGVYKTPGWGNQIRNYVLHPYKLVKDLRTDIESTNPDAVLNGDLEQFIEAQIKL